METKDELLIKAFNKEPIIVLIGQSGSGKGTVREAIINEYKRLLPDKPFLISETGELLRNAFPGMSSWNRTRLKELQERGEFQSAAVASCLWSINFLAFYEGGIIIVDGSPRTVDEVPVMINLYHRDAKKEIIVFVLAIDDEEAERRMIQRNDDWIAEGKEIRKDTATPEARKEKLAQFHQHTVPALELIQCQPCVRLYQIDASAGKHIVANRILSLLERFHSE